MSEPGIPDLLRDHARTFALTLQLLPKALRQSLGIAYLLARASDTVADEGSLPRAERIEMLRELHDLLRCGNGVRWKPTLPAEAFSAEERKYPELLAAVPRLLGLIESHPDCQEILILWETIVEGQLFDLQRFGHDEVPLSRAELERYCYLVAGSVGETWTRLIARHAAEVITQELAVMVPLGCSYGKGLQLVNILRDRAADRAIGRHYIQEEEAGELFDLAEGWLAEGLKYLSLLRPGRTLYATALPHDLALRTLRGIRSAGNARQMKVTRTDVRRVLARNLPSLLLPRRGNPVS